MLTPSLPADALRRAFVKRTLAYLGGAVLLGMIVQGLIACFISRAEMIRWMRAEPLPLAQIVLFLGAAWLARWWGEAGFARPWQIVGLIVHAIVQGIALAPVTMLLLGSGSAWWWSAAFLMLLLMAASVFVESSRGLGFYRSDEGEAAALVLSASMAGPFWYGGRLVYCAIRSRD